MTPGPAWMTEKGHSSQGQGACESDQEFSPLSATARTQQVQPHFPERPELTHCSHLSQQTSACLPAGTPPSVTSGSSTGSIRQLGKVGEVLKMAIGTFLSAQTGLMSLQQSHGTAQHPDRLKAFTQCQHPAPLAWSTGTLSLACCQPSTQPRNAPAAAAQLLLSLRRAAGAWCPPACQQ